MDFDLVLQVVAIFMGITSIGTVIFSFTKKSDKTNTIQDKAIAILEERFNNICGDITLIKENHLSHIEDDIKKMAGAIVRINTILDERTKL